jgi:glycosyltransferase involved in cell wall biosynthesis
MDQIGELKEGTQSSMIGRAKINVGILLPREISGGHFQLALSITDSLLKFSDTYAYTILYYDRKMLDWLVNVHTASKLVRVEKRNEWQRLGALANLLLHARVFPMTSRSQVANLSTAGIDLLLIPYNGMFGYMHGLPYVINITSVMHKGHARSPVRLSFKDRLFADILYRYSTRKSVLSVVDSRMGKADLSRWYGIESDKISIIPFIPAGYIYENAGMDLVTAERILDKYSLPERFIFYPARFWHVKNHGFMVRSLSSIDARHNVKVPLVLVGQPDKTYEEVMRIAKDLDMQNQIIHLGYVSDKEIVALYKKAVALVYPSLAGPTNLPPVEAMVLGTPVLCSDLFSMPEQVGDAGLLFDPFSTEDMAEKIYTIWTNDNLRQELVQKGYEKIKDLTQENYARQWENVIEAALQKIH